MRDTTLGFLAAALTLVPWGLGTFGGPAFREGIMAANGNSAANDTVFTPITAAQSAITSLSAVVSGTGSSIVEPANWVTRCDEQQAPWWPLSALVSLLWLQTALTLVAAAAILIYGARHRFENFPAIFLALIVVTPLVGKLILLHNSYDHYLYPAI